MLSQEIISDRRLGDAGQRSMKYECYLGAAVAGEMKMIGIPRIVDEATGRGPFAGQWAGRRIARGTTYHE